VKQSPGLDGPSLQRFLDSVEPERGGVVRSIRPISGGYSRLSCVAEVGWSDGTSETFVLRADPPRGTGVFDSDRDDEFSLLRSLHGRLPVHTPTVRWYDGSGEFFGAKCLIVDFFAGTPLFDLGQRDLGTARDLFVDTIASVHEAPLDAVPAEFAQPTDWETYIDEVLELTRTIDLPLVESNPAVHYAAAQLAAHRPPPVPLTLVHGDCQPANVLVPADGPVLVFDWEFARIGDPREDLGYYSELPVPPNLYGADPDAFLARYRDRTGLTWEQVNPTTVSYFYVLGLARLLAQMLGAADAIARGEPRGAMAMYMLNGISATTSRFVEIANRVANQEQL
jgi:aminoglycoside phosphotransferase (APT) family kinase protein